MRGRRGFPAADVGEVFAADADGERFGAQASAAAGRAGIVGSPAAQEDAEVHLVFAAIEPAEEAVEAAEVALGDALFDDLELLLR